MPAADGGRDATAAEEAALLGAALGGMDDAAEVLDRCLTGEVPEANALPQLRHLYSQKPKVVVAALCEKLNIVLAHAIRDKRMATRAGMILVNAAFALDGRAASSRDGEAAGEATRNLLDHLLLASGGAGSERAPKEHVVRAQACVLVAILAEALPGHKGAEKKLLQYAVDRVPSIREKAVRGLAALERSPAVQFALANLTNDLSTAVRASAVRALRIDASSVVTLLSRIDDVEACVRVQLFNRLADQPETVDLIGAVTMARLIAGLVDRAGPVRAAAGIAVDAWRDRLGSALMLIARCDVTDDEALGEAIAGALALRYPVEASLAAREWLRSNVDQKGAGSTAAKGRGIKERAAAMGGTTGTLLARFAIASMKDEERDEVLDLPALVERTREALDAAPPTWRRDMSSQWNDFLLRQLLHVVAISDFCDEGMRRNVEHLAEAVLVRSPIPTSGAQVMAATRSGRQPYTAIDLAVVILRQCSGLSQSVQARTRKHQQMENDFSRRMVFLIGDICQPYEGDGDSEHGFAGRLSRQLLQLNAAIEERSEEKARVKATMQKAIADEDFMMCHELKDQSKRNEAELANLQEKATKLGAERDSVCLRVTALITALLRWSSSNLRMDPALFGTLQTILQPMVTLPALSEDVDIAAITAICLFCTRDGSSARGHWSLLLQLVRNLRDGSGNRSLVRARASVAAKTLADCARLHSESGQLDRDEVVGAALSLAAVPFHARQIALEPLCGWLLSLGHIFFEEHLLEPVLEVQWALGWMLVEAFRQRASNLNRNTSTDEQDAEGEVDTQISMQLTQFFSLLPKLPGKQGAPLLSLAVESVAENGLWRLAVLQPQSVGFHTRFVRTFSWPALFVFAHERSPPEMRFRLWKCALQLCVMEPRLAPLAEVPVALSNVIQKGEAPPGAAELVQEALRLGAEKEDLLPLTSRLPGASEAASGGWLQSRDEARAADKARREALASIGIDDLEDWAPSSMKLPEIEPPSIRMRQAKGGGRGARVGGSSAAGTPASRRAPAGGNSAAATPTGTSQATPKPPRATAEIKATSVGYGDNVSLTQAIVAHTPKQKKNDLMPPPPVAPEKRRRVQSKTAEQQRPLQEIQAS